MINFGIIGCGWIAEKAYLPILTEMDDVGVNAIFDIDYHKAHEIQDKYHVPNIFNNIDCFLSQPLDAVIIATPNNTHTYYANMALSVRKHVLCEKPVAFSKNDIECTIATALAKNKIFLPAFVNRFRKDIVRFSEMVSLIGEVKEVEVNWNRSSGIPRPGTWITNKAAAGGGALIDIGTHVIDIGLNFLSDKQIKSVKLDQGTIAQAKQNSAQWNINNESRQFELDVETWAKGEIYFINGSELKFNIDWSSDINEDITSIKVLGVNGTASIDTLFGFSNNFIRENIEILYNGTNGEYDKVLYSMNNTFAIDAFKNMIRYFINVVNGQAAGILQPFDSVYVVDVIERLYKSV